MTNKKSLVNRCEPIPRIGDHETAVFLDAHILARRQKCETKKNYGREEILTKSEWI